MPNKILDPPLSSIANTHIGLLQKTDVVGTFAKWSSPGKVSMKRQPNLFGGNSLEVLIKKGMIREEVLLDEEELYCDCVPSKLENRFFRYRVNSVEESKKNNFNLTYLEQCTKYNGKEWISLPDDYVSVVLENFPKFLVLVGHVKMKEKMATICKYHRQKDNVFKSTLLTPNLEPSCAKDVGIHGMIQAANADREKGCNSYGILKVSHV